MLSTSFPPLATTPLLSLYGKTPKSIINAGSFPFLSSHSPLNTLQLSPDPQNSIATTTSMLLHPVVNAPVFTLRDPSAASDLVNASTSMHFPSLATSTRCGLSSYLTLCSFSIFAFSSSSLDFYLEMTPKLSLWTPSLSALIILVISFRSMLLNSINKLMTPKFISVAHISPLISRHIYSTTRLTSPLEYYLKANYRSKTELMICA